MRAILDNPRYTGYAFFGRWTKHETLLDPDDVAAGHVVRFRRAGADRVVRSREQAQPAIVTVETFTEAQLRRRSRAAGGNLQRAKLERTRTTGTRPYLLRGMVRCALCSRKMQGAVIRKHETYYRCLARTLAPGAAAHADHPRTVNLREYDVLEPLNPGVRILHECASVHSGLGFKPLAHLDHETIASNWFAPPSCVPRDSCSDTRRAAKHANRDNYSFVHPRGSDFVLRLRGLVGSGAGKGDGLFCRAGFRRSGISGALRDR